MTHNKKKKKQDKVEAQVEDQNDENEDNEEEKANTRPKIEGYPIKMIYCKCKCF